MPIGYVTTCSCRAAFACAMHPRRRSICYDIGIVLIESGSVYRYGSVASIYLLGQFRLLCTLLLTTYYIRGSRCAKGPVTRRGAHSTTNSVGLVAKTNFCQGATARRNDHFIFTISIHIYIYIYLVIINSANVL